MKQQLIVATRRWEPVPRIVASLERHRRGGWRRGEPRFVLRSGQM
jgi:hypothetical protein